MTSLFPREYVWDANINLKGLSNQDSHVPLKYSEYLGI